MNNEAKVNLSTLPKEVKLSIEIIKQSSISEIEKLASDKEIDWNTFIDYALHHRLYPSLYRLVKQLKSTVIPSFVIETLGSYYKRNTIQMLQLSAEMERVSRLFIENQIELLFLKGPVIAQYLYGDISMRTSGDLDFLIPIQKLPQAEALLIEQGYEKDDYIETVLEDWRWRHHHVTYYHPITGIKLEIHWRLHPGPGKEPHFYRLWERKQQSTLTTFPVYFLGQEDLFIFLVSHGARHGWSRLRWLADIDRFLKMKDSLVKTNQVFEQQAVHLVGQAMLLSNSLFHTKIPTELQWFLEKERVQKLAEEAMFYLERKVNLHTPPLPKDVSLFHSRHLFSLMSTERKVLYVASCFFPYPEDAATLPLPKSLHFLYFPLRPFLWAWRKMKKPNATGRYAK
ncbi:nucleotidyltransferase family protein [Alkalihalobacillus sp. LMS39]|uniref:nucleotidyltransferase domain-containing protein n=1 Tax=Alkalihalobacillus sp. LMS39 TaxID=2924032 RepID=UPI001FB366A8|nr:nucleotidyltransferase family protein [Alkalihalobacillus sp. LMS39]UOE95449.1 nucleotidyltransferase family protein [Alkalihalobacillus sp. LMS39]